MKKEKIFGFLCRLALIVFIGYLIILEDYFYRFVRIRTVVDLLYRIGQRAFLHGFKINSSFKILTGFQDFQFLHCRQILKKNADLEFIEIDFFTGRKRFLNALEKLIQLVHRRLLKCFMLCDNNRERNAFPEEIKKDILF